MQKFVPGMLQLILIDRVVEDALQITLIISHLKF